MALNKRQKAILAATVPGKAYAIEDALKILKDNSKAKFVEAIDVAVRLGVDAKKSDQQVRGSTVLPAGTGKSVRVAVSVSYTHLDVYKRQPGVPSGAVLDWLLQREHALTSNTLPNPSANSADFVKYALALLLVAAGIAGYYYFDGQWPGIVRALVVVVAVVLAAVVFMGTAKGVQARGFLTEYRFELRKVVWPTRQEATKTMWVVLVAVIVISLILAAMDWIIPCSYTHLDVYKRQPQVRLSPNFQPLVFFDVPERRFGIG